MFIPQIIIHSSGLSFCTVLSKLLLQLESVRLVYSGNYVMFCEFCLLF